MSTISPDGQSWLYETSVLAVPKGSHYYAHAFYQDGGDSVYSNAVLISGDNTLAAPTNFTATALTTLSSGGGANLSWTLPPSIAGLQVQIDRSADGGANWTTIATLSSTSTYTDSIAPEAANVQYRIRSTDTLNGTNSAGSNEEGYSDYSSTISVNTQPAAPAVLTAVSPASGEVDLTWLDKSQGESGYLIQAFTDSSHYSLVGTVSTSPDATQAQIAGLPQASTYYFEISATSASGPASAIQTFSVTNSSGNNFTITPIGSPAVVGIDGKPQAGWFQITRSAGLSLPASVSIGYSGTGFQGDDYTLKTDVGSSAQQINFQPYQTTAIVELDPKTGGETSFPTVTASVGSASSATLTIQTPVNLSLTAYRTGNNFGTAVSQSVQQGGDPANYVILADNSGSTTGQAISNPAVGTDQDLAEITLHELTGVPSFGTITLSASDPSAVRFFQDDGAQLTQSTLYLSGPNGYLAGLLSGDVNVWVEGLAAEPNEAITFAYSNASGTGVAEQSVHMNVADWTFIDRAGNAVTEVEQNSEQLLLDDLQGDPTAPRAADDVSFKNNIQGLDIGTVGSLYIDSALASDVSQEDNLVEQNGGSVQSKEFVALYMPADGEENLSVGQCAELDGAEQLNALAGSTAAETLTTHSDSFSMTVIAKSQSTTQHLYDLLTQDSGYGDKVKFVLDRMDWNNDGNGWQKRMVLVALNGKNFAVSNGNIYVNPAGTDAQLQSWALDGLREWAAAGVDGLWAGTSGNFKPGPQNLYFAVIARQWARSFYWQVSTTDPIAETFTAPVAHGVPAYSGTVNPNHSPDAALLSLTQTLDFLYFFSSGGSGAPIPEKMYPPTWSDDGNANRRVNLPEVYLWAFANRKSIFNPAEHAQYAVNIPTNFGINSDYFEAATSGAHNTPAVTIRGRTTYPGDDQLHHFAGYFYLGEYAYSYPSLTYNYILVKALKQTGDYPPPPTPQNPNPQNPNLGDYYLGIVAFDLGTYYEAHPGYISQTIFQRLSVIWQQANKMAGRSSNP